MLSYRSSLISSAFRKHHSASFPWWIFNWGRIYFLVYQETCDRQMLTAFPEIYGAFKLNHVNLAYLLTISSQNLSSWTIVSNHLRSTTKSEGSAQFRGAGSILRRIDHAGLPSSSGDLILVESTIMTSLAGRKFCR
jgi:hypothetical protein